MGLCLSLKYVNLKVPLGIILMLWVVLRCLVVGVVCLQPPRTECWRLGIGGDSGASVSGFGGIPLCSTSLRCVMN